MTEAWTRRRVLFLAISGVLTAAVMLWAGRVLLPFLVAIVLAYVLTPVVDWWQARGVARGVAVCVVCLATFGLVVSSGAIGLPRLYKEAVDLRQGLPELGRQVAEVWGPWLEKKSEAFVGRTPDPAASDEPVPQLNIVPLPSGGYGLTVSGPIDVIQKNAKHWQLRPSEVSEPFDFQRWVQGLIDGSFDYVRENTRELLRLGGAVIGSVSRTIFLSFMTLMSAGYLMYTRDKIARFFRSLPPASSRDSYDRFLQRLDRGLSGVVRGQLIICVVNGALSGVGFALFELKYWPLLTVVATLLSVIPIFGAILSSIPAVMVGLTQGPWTALWVLVWIIGIHQIEANVLNPKIMGGAAKLHPVLVIFVLVLGEHAYGISGALFAVPTLSIVQSVFLHFREEWFTDPPPPIEISLPPEV